MLNSDIIIPEHTLEDYIKSLCDKKLGKGPLILGGSVAAATVAAAATTGAIAATTEITTPILTAAGITGGVLVTSKAKILEKIAKDYGVKDANSIYYTEILKNIWEVV